MSYRPALDGIRAVAVIFVVLYHLGLPLLGGFLGVDIFFTLSGYLITTLLVTEHAAAGRIDLVRFWSRRVRRLLPAILLLLLATAVVVHRASPLVSLPARRGDMLATLLYYANWHFIATDQSYFADFLGVSPLRHMWSLAIEEQFYVIWPAVMAGVLTLRRRWRFIGPAAVLAVGAATVASAIAMALVYNPENPSRAYYGTDTRAHALLIGAALAAAMLRWPAHSHQPLAERLASLAAPIASALVGFAVLVTSDRNPIYYRGGSLAFALLVAMWIWSIEAQSSSAVARALSRAPVVYLGRISYGLYLWHWPIIIWLGVSRAGLPRQVAAVLLTLAVAAASYHVIESPIRRGRPRWLVLSAPRLAMTASAMMLLTATAAVGATRDSNLGIALSVKDVSVRGCPAKTSGGWCVRVQPSGPRAPTIAVVGDSTSLALDPGMRLIARVRGWGYVQAGRNGCSFVPLAMGASGSIGAAQGARCATQASRLLDDLTAGADPDIWIVSDGFLRATLHHDGRELVSGDLERDTLITATLRETLRRLTSAGARVLLLETPPQGEPVDCALGSGLSSCGSPEFSAAHPPSRHLNLLFRQVASEVSNVHTLEIADMMCQAPNGRCEAVVGGLLARYDGVHYTAAFSRRLVPLLIERAELQGFEFKTAE